MKFVAARNTHCGSFALKAGDEVPEWVIEQKAVQFEDLVKAGFVVGTDGHVEAKMEEAEPEVEAKPKRTKKKD